MHPYSDFSQLHLLKQNLNDLICIKNYDLLDPEVIQLSQQLDKLLTPIFDKQHQTEQIIYHL